MDEKTVVFMINRDRRGVSPAIRLRYTQGYRIFAVRPQRKNPLAPFNLTVDVLTLLRKILTVIEQDKDPFVCFLQFSKNRVDKIPITPTRPVVAVPARSKSKRDKRRKPSHEGVPSLFQQV